MEAMVLDVQKLFYEEFTRVTERLSHLALEPSNSFEKRPTDLVGTIKVRENPFYDLLVICSISNSLAQQIVREMSRGMVSTQEEINIYLTEYFNITSGKVITHINNYIGKSIRFSVPTVSKTQEGIANFEKYMERFCIAFESTYGEMLLEVGYTVKDREYL